MIFRRNITTRANTDTWLAPNVFFKEEIRRQIAIDELVGLGGGGGGDLVLLKTFPNIWKWRQAALRSIRFKH